MRVWTFQDPALWRKLLNKSFIDADGRRVFAEFKSAYAWMCSQYAEFNQGYAGRALFWCWREKPDLRRLTKRQRYTDQVLIEYEADASQVLFSCFGLWHCVLNNQAAALNEAEWEYWRGLLRPCCGTGKRPEEL